MITSFHKEDSIKS